MNLPCYQTLKIKYSLLILFTIAFFLSVCSSANSSLRSKFELYVKENELEFSSPIEKNYRFKIFCNNLSQVNEFNKKNPEVKLDLNEFGLLTKTEFTNKMTNPDFLFFDSEGKKEHVNVNDPYNEYLIDSHIDKENRKLINILDNEIKSNNNQMKKTNWIWKLENNLKEADEDAQAEIKQIELFLIDNHLNNKISEKSKKSIENNLDFSIDKRKKRYENQAHNTLSHIYENHPDLRHTTPNHHLEVFPIHLKQITPSFQNNSHDNFIFKKKSIKSKKKILKNIAGDIDSISPNDLHLSNCIFKDSHRILQSSNMMTGIDPDILKLPAYINWAEEGKTTKIKYQGLCRSCYAFSGLASVESAILIKYEKNIILSEQEILACGTVDPYRMKGCSGGRPSQVLRYISENGINVEKNYPYDDSQAVDVELKCERDLNKPKFEHYIFSGRPSRNIISIMKFLEHGPVVVNHYVPQFFEYYSSGIFKPYNCPVLRHLNEKPVDMTLDHSSIIVGYNFISENKPYFILKNSWGLRWGEKGKTI